MQREREFVHLDLAVPGEHGAAHHHQHFFHPLRAHTGTDHLKESFVQRAGWLVIADHDVFDVPHDLAVCDYRAIIDRRDRSQRAAVSVPRNRALSSASPLPCGAEVGWKVLEHILVLVKHQPMPAFVKIVGQFDDPPHPPL